jgi:hypothetical protein
MKRVNNDDSSEIECEGFCDEKCEGEFRKYQENTPKKLAERQKRQELLDKGYKPCGKNLIPFEPLKIDCNNLISPTEKMCESCQKLEEGGEKEEKRKIHEAEVREEQKW